LIKKALITVLVFGIGAFAAVLDYTDGHKTTVITAADTNAVSGTITLNDDGMMDEARKQSRWDGLFLDLWASDMHCDSIADVGEIDTLVVNVYGTFGDIKHSMLYDTLAGLPGTTYVIANHDTTLSIFDNIFVDYTFWDTATTVRDSSGIVTCTLKTDFRLWRD